MDFDHLTRKGLRRGVVVCALMLGAMSATAQQADRSAERAARRAQQQMQGLQQQLQQTQAEKARLDAEREDISKKLKAREGAAARAAAAQRASQAKLAEVEAEKALLLSKLAELEKTLDQEKRSSDAALAEKDAALAQAANRLKAQEAAQATLQGRFGDQVRLVTECSEKNDRLARIGNELIERYRNKGVWDAVRQREPLLGLTEVQLFNQLQEVRDRADAERFVPSVERR